MDIHILGIAAWREKRIRIRICNFYLAAYALSSNDLDAHRRSLVPVTWPTDTTNPIAGFDVRSPQ